MQFFGPWDSAAQFAKEWRRLSDQDKADLKKGIQDGTLNY